MGKQRYVTQDATSKRGKKASEDQLAKFQTAKNDYFKGMNA